MQTRSKTRVVTPINRLSQDILLEIFTILRDDETVTDDSDDYYWNWIIITHVCHSWRTLALQTPFLWSHMSYFISTERTKLFLERSKDANIIVHAGSSDLEDSEYYGGYYYGLHDGEKFDSLILMLQHVHRITHLSILLVQHEMKRVWEDFLDLMKRPAPRLQSLRLRGLPYLPDLPHSYPLLKSLDLEGLNIPTGISHLTGLGLIELRLHKVLGLTPVAFLSALASCSNLRTLYVHWPEWSLEEGPSSHSLEGVVVNLPNLLLFSISLRGPGKFEDWDDEIFRRINIPATSDWQCFYNTTESSSILELKAYRRLSERIACCEELSIILQSYGIRSLSQNTVNSIASEDSNSTSTSSAKFSLDLDLNWGPFESSFTLFPYLDSLITAPHFNRTKRLNLHVSNRWVWVFNDHIWISLLLKLSSVQSLELVIEEHPGRMGNARGDIEIFLEVLTHQSQVPIPNNAVLCPALEHLSLQWDMDIPGRPVEILKKGLQNRKRMGLALKTLSIGSKRVLKRDVMVLSDLVEELSWKGFMTHDVEYYWARFPYPSHRKIGWF